MDRSGFFGRASTAAIALAAIMLTGCVANIARVGTGYSSKIMCSSVYVSGRDPARISSVDLAATEGYPISVDVMRDEKSVAAAMLGLFEQKTIYNEGLGCTVAAAGTEDRVRALAEHAPGPLPPLSADEPWPRGQKVDTSALPEGVDQEALDKAMDFAFKPGVGARAVVVVHEGKIIAERYASGFDVDTPLLGWSMTKGVISALIGILVGDGKLEVDEPAPVPEWKGPEDPRSEITLSNLLYMSSGLEFVEEYEDNITSDCNLMLFVEPDMAAYAAKKPLVHEPGEHFSYSSGTANILARIVRRQVGDDEKYLSFPKERLFGKIGMTSAVMEPDASGTFVGSSYMYATARDWARFGLLYLNDGVWEGERILPEGWVDYSVTPGPATGGEYGAQWWLNARPGKERWMPELPDDVYSARGHDGQYVTVLPSSELVVARLGFTPNHKKNWDHQEFLKMVIAAVGD